MREAKKQTKRRFFIFEYTTHIHLISDQWILRILWMPSHHSFRHFTPKIPQSQHINASKIIWATELYRFTRVMNCFDGKQITSAIGLIIKISWLIYKHNQTRFFSESCSIHVSSPVIYMYIYSTTFNLIISDVYMYFKLPHWFTHIERQHIVSNDSYRLLFFFLSHLVRLNTTDKSLSFSLLPHSYRQCKMVQVHSIDLQIIISFAFE